jgi:hypothetical protein
MIDWFVNNVINCETRLDFDQSLNHISILITFTLEIDSMLFKQKKTWKRIKIDKLRKSLLLFIVSSSLINIEQMNVFVSFIQSSIQRVIDAIVSWTKFVSKSKSHWNQRCVDVVLTTRRKRCVWFAMRTKQTWHEYFKTTNEKKKIIARKKKIEFRQAFRFFIDTSFEFWRLIVWTKNKNHKSKEVFKIFALTKRNAFHVILETIEDLLFKIEMLHQHFFSNTTKTNLNDLKKFNYRVVVEKSIINIQENKIMQIIKRCKSNNVSKFDDISNKILKILCAKIMLSLINLFQACVELSYHFFCFKIAHIIVFKKLNKKNHLNVKTYKFIILLNTLNKILKSIIIRRINSLTKTHNMFSISQMNDRKNKNCETALKLFIEQIHTVWNMKKDKITTLLNMNVIDVYDHVFKNKLLHNLRKKNIFHWIIRRTNNFIKDKHISLTFDNATMTFRLIKTNISQKSFISSIFYLFYNVDLLKIFEKSSRRIAIVNFVNDINFLIYDIYTKQNCQTLKRFYQECETWSRRHEIAFASIKYELIHLTRNHWRFNMQIELRIEAIQKTFALYVRILNVQINNKLKWKSHVRTIQKKMITQMMTLSRLTTFTWRTCFARARLIYSSIIKFAIIYDNLV